MPMKCCVTGCDSNYELKDVKSEYITVYRILSECKGDDAKLETWRRRIPRESLQINDNTLVCIKHFVPQFIVTHEYYSAVRPDGTVLSVRRKTPKLTKI